MALPEDNTIVPEDLESEESTEIIAEDKVQEEPVPAPVKKKKVTKKATKKVATKKTATKKAAKKTTAKKTATKKVAKKVATKKVATKKTATKKKKKEVSEELEVNQTTRKAPVTLPDVGPARKFPLTIVLTLGAFMLTFGISAVIGLKGDGVIDVAQLIEAKQQREIASSLPPIAEGEVAPVVEDKSIPPPPNNTVVNGGLRGSGSSAPDAAPVTSVEEVPAPVPEGNVDGQTEEQAAPVEAESAAVAPENEVPAEEIPTEATTE